MRGCSAVLKSFPVVPEQHKQQDSRKARMQAYAPLWWFNERARNLTLGHLHECAPSVLHHSTTALTNIR